MRLHPQEHIVQQLHRLHDEGAFVQHNAFRSVSHRHIGHPGARAHASFSCVLRPMASSPVLIWSIGLAFVAEAQPPTSIVKWPGA
jgi:hypothetical protein